MNRNTADVIVHLNDTPDAARLEKLVSALAGLSGVVKVRAHRSIRRFLMVDYNPTKIRAQAILEDLRRRGHGAVLVGM
jgi:hypothetical protein